MNIEFPIYRKLANNKVFYKIISDNEFIEKKIMGSKIFESNFKATQYPEKLMIMDLIQTTEYYLLSTENEWLELI
jgi:hypothetical protein